MEELLRTCCGRKGVRLGQVDCGGEKTKSSPRLGLGTILGLLDQSHTYVGLHTKFMGLRFGYDLRRCYALKTAQ